MEKIIEGKIEYESKNYAFYYINNILTLIPDEELEEVWKNMFKSQKERTIDHNLTLEGKTSYGYRIKFINIKLTKQSGGKVKIGEKIENITNTFDFHYYLPEEDKIDLPDINSCIKYEQIKTNFKDLYLTINNKGAYKNYYNLNRDDELKVTIDKYHNISSAFESWFDINFPEFKDEILSSDMEVVAFVIVEKLVQCLILYKANIEMDKIKEIVDDRF